jgi:uncharacterized repeat protein (TIGR03803 family)
MFARCVLFCLWPALAGASSFQTLYTFPAGTGPAAPDVGLVLGQNGVLYGAIAATQNIPNGAIFAFNLASLSFSTLYAFSGGDDGAAPQQTLVFDQAGNLYGSTEFGGNGACQAGGCGTVFKLDPATGRLSTLHAFADLATEGAYPDTGSLVFGLGGALYGETPDGGSSGGGTIYTISPAGGTLTVLASFGNTPAGAMAITAAGVIYGTTLTGGAAGAGTLFSLSPPTAGQTVWTPETLYSFTGTTDGGYPYSGVITGRAGALYGTTESGGNGPGDGTAFQFVPATGDFRTIWRFSANTGTYPYAPLCVDTNFDLLGVAPSGGALPRKCQTGCGTVFKLVNPGWAASVVHEFANGAGGMRPQSSLVGDTKGHFYGTASGGRGGGGIIFEVTP